MMALCVRILEKLLCCVASLTRLLLSVSAASDLDSIRALFNEKEKELSLAVAKVEELTHQLEELRRGRQNALTGQLPASIELDKLRRELMVSRRSPGAD